MIKISKKIKNLFSILILSLFILMLISCSVNKNHRNIFSSYDDVSMETAYETTAAYQMMDGGGYINAAPAMKLAAVNGSVRAVYEESADYDFASGSSTSERKLIRNFNIDAETTNFDSVHEGLLKTIQQYNGIVNNSSINNNKKQVRTLNMTIKIPAEKVDLFLDNISNAVNVTFRSESVQDVTDNYEDVEARLKTLKKEHASLEDMLSSATKIEDLIKIKDRISSVQYEIESYEKRLKNYDKNINYSTIYFSLTEVQVLTEVKKDIPTSDKILQAFNKNLEDTKNYVIGLGIYIFTHIPAICFVLICVFIVLIILNIIKAIYYKSKNKKKPNAVKVENTVSNTTQKNTTETNKTTKAKETQVDKNISEKKVEDYTPTNKLDNNEIKSVKLEFKNNQGLEN